MIDIFALFPLWIWVITCGMFFAVGYFLGVSKENGSEIWKEVKKDDKEVVKANRYPYH